MRLQMSPYVMPSPAGSQCYAQYYCSAAAGQQCVVAGASQPPAICAPPPPQPPSSAMMASVVPGSPSAMNGNCNNNQSATAATDLQASRARNSAVADKPRDDAFVQYATAWLTPKTHGVDRSVVKYGGQERSNCFRRLEKLVLPSIFDTNLSSLMI